MFSHKYFNWINSLFILFLFSNSNVLIYPPTSDMGVFLLLFFFFFFFFLGGYITELEHAAARPGQGRPNPGAHMGEKRGKKGVKGWVSWWTIDWKCLSWRSLLPPSSSPLLFFQTCNRALRTILVYILTQHYISKAQQCVCSAGNAYSIFGWSNAMRCDAGSFSVQ